MFADGDYTHKDVDELAGIIFKAAPVRPQLGIIIGTGFAKYADTLADRVDIPYATLPGFPMPCLPGHEPKYVLGRINDLPVIAAAGKFPLLCGYHPRVPMIHVRLFHALGCESLVYTNTVGSVNRSIEPGSFLVFTDHVNWPGNIVLSPSVDSEWGDVLIDTAGAYDPAFRELALEASAAIGEPLAESVYGRFIGAQFETPAEIRVAALLGVDAVGGTTVEEVIAAKQLGMPTLVLGYASNPAAGVAAFDNQEILSNAERDLARFGKLIDAIVTRYATAKHRIVSARLRQGDRAPRRTGDLQAESAPR
jgi:purine-nucleoside phosphorylase